MTATPSLIVMLRAVQAGVPDFAGHTAADIERAYLTLEDPMCRPDDFPPYACDRGHEIVAGLGCAECDPPPPGPAEPCDLDECGHSCYLEDAGWVYEGSRINGFGAEEDCQFYCMCEHHKP
jgi:hypothetical protein